MREASQEVLNFCHRFLFFVVSTFPISNDQPAVKFKRQFEIPHYASLDKGERERYIARRVPFLLILPKAPWEPIASGSPLEVIYNEGQTLPKRKQHAQLLILSIFSDGVLVSATFMLCRKQHPRIILHKDGTILVTKGAEIVQRH